MTTIENVTALQFVGYVVLGGALSIIGLFSAAVYVWDRWIGAKNYWLDVCERSRAAAERRRDVRPFRRHRHAADRARSNGLMTRPMPLPFEDPLLLLSGGDLKREIAGASKMSVSAIAAASSGEDAS